MAVRGGRGDEARIHGSSRRRRRFHSVLPFRPNCYPSPSQLLSRRRRTKGTGTKAACSPYLLLVDKSSHAFHDTNKYIYIYTTNLGGKQSKARLEI
jgi:hypothetical protein